MVKLAVATASTVKAVRGLPTPVVANLRHALQEIDVPRTPEEIELLAIAVLGRKRPASAMEEVAKCEHMVDLSPSTLETLLSHNELSEAKSRLDAEIAEVPAAFREWAHRLVCELCVMHYLVPAGDHKLRPCDGFPFPPRGQLQVA